MSQPPTILVVEDEPLIQNLIEAALEDGGFRVVAATSGREAIERLDQDSSTVSGLVTDIDPGDGIKGWEVARHGRQHNPTLAVVYMSGGSAHEWESEGVPNSNILTKPFAPAQMVVALAAQLNQPPTAASWVLSPCAGHARRNRP
jgi:two-component system cell cycle response regulator CpdR